ncbi:uncharacterized protein MKK02DRAFT_29651 [Dioszegia hungarica]|uniref:RRM domain-containing protein n=1 Tax=Dioszegia hungarica TaxID=4972 RepID=A0AA38HEA8_9TREE|nr:uncharacterized protein MKK02DRAFT_29651 [Dioszegia hungarica]KAI9639632.1 hypothetical protein MKK02DRAFT_29651 [Dioszegia hungarica]
MDAQPSGAGSSKKSTVYVAGLAPEVNEQQLLEAFVTFGDILEISLPHEANEPNKHRGFAFLTFSNPADAQEAIDNFDLNELPGYQGRGRFLKCSLAQPDRFQKAGGEGGAGKGYDRAVWESEEWLQKNAKPAEGQAAAGADGDGEEAA